MAQLSPKCPNMPNFFDQVRFFRSRRQGRPRSSRSVCFSPRGASCPSKASVAKSGTKVTKTCQNRNNIENRHFDPTFLKKKYFFTKSTSLIPKIALPSRNSDLFFSTLQKCFFTKRKKLTHTHTSPLVLPWSHRPPVVGIPDLNLHTPIMSLIIRF